ncbi:TonB-dependent receptor [Roseateles saccharophilus]|uniref:Iron complex outermembrane receptor protein n=1 Tax=Roseateles saccharophilus TaxID=304 RepID=A0A4R3VBM8_ROSSA|nr:TonB-dependent receptor [Roseateles saccharophilus]MDG0831576.1 TonB-dependent receptor [Roseateles saccharophilus]TCV01014.1 iron complex outermembrane receptor protein [Roseateles saccharophilus]
MPRRHPARSRLHFAILATLGATAALPAAAQTAPAAEPQVTTLEVVKVTARKREESLQDVPVAVTALTAEQLDRLAVKDLGDLQGQVPNLTIYAARGSNTTITTFIRGVGQADPLWGVDPGVGIYFDDVYIARPQGALLDVYDVQRVEVLRGPQGTLYGKNTVGGAVKYVSKPLPQKTEGAVTLAVGDYGQVTAKGAVGTAADDGQLRLRLAGASLNRDGYGKNLTDGSPVSDQNTTSGRFSAGWFPTGSSFNAQVSVDRTQDASHMRGFQRLAVNKFDPAKTPPGDSRYDIASGMPNANSTKSEGESLTLNWGVSEAWGLKYIAAHRASDTSTAIDFDGLPAKIADVRAEYHDSSQSHELQATYEGASSSGVIGLYYFDGRAGGTVRNNFFNLSFGTTNGTVYTKGKAVYGDWSWRLTPQFSVSTGLRYTDESKRAVVLNQAFANDTFSGAPLATLANFDSSRSVTNTSPRLSLEYKASNAVKLYTTASRGFKSGGYNIRANTLAVPASGRPFDDEKLDSLEVGAKMILDGGRLELNTALFHNNYKNVQLSVFTSYTQANGQPGFFGDFTNAGKATLQGGELEFLWMPTTDWRISGNLAGIDAKYDEYIDRGVNVASQKKFTNTPKFQAGLNIENSTKLPLGLLRSRLGLTYRTKVYPTTDLSESLAQDAYALVNAGLIWEKDSHLSFFLQGSNLTNKAYKTDGYNIPALGVLDAFYGPPRTFTLGGTYKF